MSLVASLVVLVAAAPPDPALLRVTARALACDASGCDVALRLSGATTERADRRFADVDVLLASAPPGARAGTSAVLTRLVGDTPWAPRVWRLAQPEGATGDGHEARVFDPFPGGVGDTLVADLPAGGQAFWVHVSDSTAAADDTVGPPAPDPDEAEGRLLGTVRVPGMTVPAGDGEPAPLPTLDAALLGAVVQPFEPADLAALGALHGADFEVLARSAGLVHGASDKLPDPDGVLLRVATQELAPGHHVFAGVAALSLLPASDSAGFVTLAAEVTRDQSPLAGFGARVEAAIQELEDRDPYAWTIASTALLTADPRDRSDARFLAEAVVSLPPEARARLVDALPDTPAAHDVLALAAGPLLGAALGLAEEPAVALIEALARRKVALLQLFDADAPEVAHRVVQLVGAERLVTLATPLLSQGLPGDLVEALASPTLELRQVASRLLAAGGAPALAAMSQRLSELGRPLDGPVGADPASLQAVISRLTGALLWPAARPYHDAAWKRHLQGLDCLPPFEEARRVIHPELVLPEPLYSQCVALRAVLMAREGAIDAALQQVEGLRSVDPLVASRHAEVVAAAAARALDAGDPERAQALLDKVPDGDAVELVGVRADLLTYKGRVALEGRDEALARRYFDAARQLDPSRPTAEWLIDRGRAAVHDLLIALLIVALCAGVAALALRTFQRAMVLHDFRLAAGTTPWITMEGPGRRRLLLAPFGILALRPFSHRQLSFAEVESAWLMSGGGGRAGVLFRLKDGSAFVVPASSLRRFDLFVAQLETHLEELNRPLETLAPLDEEVGAENEALARDLGRRDGANRMLRVMGAFVAGALVYAATIAEVAGGVWYARFAMGLGIGAGVLIVTTAAVHALLPVPRA